MARAVHDYCATVALASVWGYIYRASWTLLAIPQIASEETTYITETTCLQEADTRKSKAEKARRRQVRGRDR
jgi:hypothetical protein